MSERLTLPKAVHVSKIICFYQTFRELILVSSYMEVPASQVCPSSSREADAFGHAGYEATNVMRLWSGNAAMQRNVKFEIVM